MADLKARFSLIDEMSDKLSSISDKGQEMIDRWEQAGDTASTAIDNVTSSASQAVDSIDGISSSLDSLDNKAETAGTSADSLSSKLDTLGTSLGDAADETDHWTAAAQNYDKSALEMVYTTEELVEMGLKTVDALGNQEEMFALCEEAASKLNAEIEAAVNTHDEYANSIEQTNRAVEELTDNSKLASDVQEELEKASQSAAKALEELETAQREAQKAMDDYDNIILSGTTDLGELEEAAQRTAAAAEKLAVAQEKASKATEDYSAAADNAAKSSEESGQSGVGAIEAVADTLIAAKIAEKVYEIAEAAYALVDAYSEAEKVVVNATGATGAALDGLEQSMMKAYTGHHQDLNTTAGAIGEINTRMGLTGEKLTEVTDLFLDYSSITGTDVVGSVQKVTKVMNQWNIEGENVESVLDKLAYAGQISGASVDSLSETLITGAASFQEVGLSLDNTIQLLADFELAGINSTTAITAVRTAVNNFTKDGKDAETELQNVITKIASMENASDATALAVETFGSRAGQQLAHAIRNGTVSIDSFNTSLEVADGTLRKTAEAGETLGEKWEKSNNKIKAAFTNALQPTLDKLSSGAAKVMGAIGDFLDRHPAVTKALVAIGAGLGVAAVGIAVIAVKAIAAIPAIATFGATLQAAMGPIGWISLGATALVGGIMALTGAFSKSEDQVEDYNGTMQECASEIERTQAAYDKACELYGENSAAAQELAENLETLNAQFEKGGGAAAIYAQKAEKIAQTFDEISTSQKNAMSEIDKNETSAMTAVAMLEALSERTNLTNSDLDLMTKYADYLNDEFNCDIKVNYNTKDLTGFDPKVITETIMQAANDERIKTAMDYLSGADFQDNYINAKKAAREAYYELAALKNEQSGTNYTTTTTSVATVGSTTSSTPSKPKRSAKDIQADIDRVNEAIATYEETINQAESEIQTYGLVIDNTGEFTRSFMSACEDASHAMDVHTGSTEENTEALKAEQEGISAATTAASQFTDQILEISAAYDEAYESALKSFQGQFGLFEQASTQSDTYLKSTVANAQAALDTQLNYWTTYGNNIEVLKNTSADDLGITQKNYDALMAYVQSGDEEAAGLAQSMVDKIKSGDKDAVATLANTLANVNSKQEEIARVTADWSTHYTDQMNEIEQKMKDAVSNLDLTDEATKAALSTMNGYINQISASAFRARYAAQSVVDAVRSVFDNAHLSYTVDMKTSGAATPKHAKGTTNAEDVFIAGEEGPELIVGKAGSTVFPTSETEKIISALNGVDGTEYSGNNSYLTENNSTDNSTVNNVSPTYQQDLSQNTEIINNNYETVENISSYDDSKVIIFLDKFVAICQAIEKNTAVDEKKAAPDTESKSYAENITYGDTESIDNSRSYMTEYGDTISNVSNLENAYSDIDSREYTDIDNISDSSQSIENSLRDGDKIYKANTTYDVDNSRRMSAESVFSDSVDNAVSYGDNIRKNSSSEQLDMSRAYNSLTDSSNSRKYVTEIVYGDFDNDTNVATDNYDNRLSAKDIDVLTTNAENIVNNANAANSYENTVESYERSSKANTTYDVDNSRRMSAESVFIAVTDTNVGHILSNSTTSADSFVSGDSYSSISESPSYSAISENNSSYGGSSAFTADYSNISSTSESYENALRNEGNNYSTVIAYNFENVRNGSAGTVNDDTESYDYNFGGKTIDFSGDSFNNYSTSSDNSNSFYADSNSHNSVSSSSTSNAETAITEYGDSIKRFEETIEQAEGTTYNSNSSAIGDTLNNTENSYNGISSAYNSVSDAENTVFGETIESISNVSGDQIINYGNSESSADSRYTYDTDANYSAITDSRNYSTAESTSNSVSYGDRSDAVETATSYGDSMNTVEQTYSSSINSSQTYENGITSVIFPVWENLLELFGKSLRSDFSESKEYFSKAETFNHDFAELTPADVVLEIPDLALPESETSIVNAENTSTIIMPPEERKREEKDDNHDDGKKHIVLEIAGSGSIDITNGVDKEQVLELLQENLKPVLMGIIANEIYEEGDNSYDF